MSSPGGARLARRTDSVEAGLAAPAPAPIRGGRRRRSGLRAWTWVHKWSSLVCTVFMLLLCLTGLPLIFHHEIAHALGNVVEPPELPAATPHVSVDRALAVARDRWPGKTVQFASQEIDDDRAWYVTLSDHADRPVGLKQVAVDARTGTALNEPPLEGGFMHVMLSLHTDLYAGLPGQLFLGGMGLLLLVAIVSGGVLYAPFMRRLAFGEVRREKPARTRWLDLHNLLGIVTLVWLSAVGATGVVNTWVDLLYDHWRATELAEMVAPYAGRPPLAELGSLQRAIDSALAHEPGMAVKFVAFPGTRFTSPHHYGIYLRGNQPLTARLYKPVLVDATTAQVTASRPVPWYLTVLRLAQPLHFGDYGGLPLQILWAALDIVTIVVLGSGLYLWWAKHRPSVAAPAGVAPASRFRPGNGSAGAFPSDGAFRRSTWAAPIALGVLSTVGLTAALLGDGAWDLASWICLGACAAACVRYGWMRG